MAYTYNISANVLGGIRRTWDSVWDGSSADSERRVGITGTTTYHQCSMIFNTSALAGKTITGINLTFTVVSGTIPSNGTQNFPICYKANSSTTSWTRTSDNPVGYIRNQTTGGSDYGASNTQMTVNVGTTLPSYGYVAGPVKTISGSAKSVILGSTATLAVTTNETYREYTLAYNANGGNGAPSSTSAGNIQVNPSCTFTVANTVPTRTGYTFLGWSTSSSASSASYVGGNSITVTTAGTTTLYAVWRVNTYTVSYNKGSYGTGTNSTDTKTYNVALTLKGAQFTRTGYAQTGWATSDSGAQAYALGGSYTANASVTLYPVWTATKSTVSTTNGTLGTAQTITITRYNTSFTHTLTYKYGNATGTIATGVGASYSWTPPTSLAAQFTAATSGVCTITCTTYSGSTNIGSSTTTCTLSIPSSIRCKVSSVSLTEAGSGSWSQFGAFVQGKSKVKLEGTISSGSGSPAYGATVSSYAITTNGQTLTSNPATTGVLNTSGNSISYSFKITDTRGYTDTYSNTYKVLAYSSPSVTASISRNSSDPSKIDVKYSYTISACENKNTKSLSIKYRVVGGNYTTIPITISSYTGSNITYQITGLDANTAYEVVVTVTDYFTPVSTTTNIQPTGNRVFDISDDDKTIARHGTNYSDGWDHQYFNEQFHGVLDVTQRRAIASLQASTSNGQWYNVLVFDARIEAGGGGIGVIIDFNICRIWQNGPNEVHKISLLLRGLSNGTYAKFTNENSTSGVVEIDKIRYRHNTVSKKAYVDIHYNYTSGNVVHVDYDVHCSNYEYQERFTSGGLTAVADAPAYNGTSDTIDALYSFDMNCYLAPLASRNHSASAVTIAAGASSAVNITIGLDNYFPIAIVSVFGNGSSGFSVSDFYLANATTARIAFRNNNSSSQTVTWSVTVLYQKN